MPILPLSGAASTKGAYIPLGSYTFPNSTLTGTGFSNIPQGYQDLMFVLNYSFTDSVAPAFIINSGGFTYSITALAGNGTSAYSNRTSNYPYGLLSQYATTFTTATSIVNIMNYASTSTFKTILHTNSFNRILSGSTDINVSLVQTLSPVTSVSFSTADGTKFFQAGSTVTLYGIRSVNQ